MAAEPPIQLAEGLWYLPAAVNTFIVAAPGARSVLVDTGQDKDYARRLLKGSRELGLEPAAIINTHAHSDHFGGNAWLLSRLPELSVHAPREAAIVIRNPLLQPLGLFHGANPLPELLQKWTHAKASRVDQELEPGDLQIAGVDFTFIDAAGHDRSQFAVKVGDVLIAADGLFGDRLLEKYPLPFSHHPGLQRESIDRLAASGARIAVPGHGDPQDPEELAEKNRLALDRVTGAVLEALAEPADLATVLSRTCRALDITIPDPVRYLLNFSTLAAWLGWLRGRELVDCDVQGTELIWRRRQLPYGEA